MRRRSSGDRLDADSRIASEVEPHALGYVGVARFEAFAVHEAVVAQGTLSIADGEQHVLEPERSEHPVVGDLERGRRGRGHEPGRRLEELQLETVGIGDHAEAAARLRDSPQPRAPCRWRRGPPIRRARSNAPRRSAGRWPRRWRCSRLAGRAADRRAARSSAYRRGSPARAAARRTRACRSGRTRPVSGTTISRCSSPRFSSGSARAWPCARASGRIVAQAPAHNAPSTVRRRTREASTLSRSCCASTGRPAARSASMISRLFATGTAAIVDRVHHEHGRRPGDTCSAGERRAISLVHGASPSSSKRALRVPDPRHVWLITG